MDRDDPDTMATDEPEPAPARTARSASASSRPILTAEVLSVGTELTTGGTRDTNAGDIARDLSAAGVWVTRLTGLPDDLGSVTDAFAGGLARADLVVSTGGLGPTPDDLTRESIAAAVGEAPAIDPVLERWLRRLFARRSVPFAQANLKQAWLLPSAAALANPNGTAPGWWVDRPDGRVIVALPGPPREMLPMWRDSALPRLRARGLGTRREVRVLRLAGIGESLLADLLEDLLRGTNPTVATYARADGVDVRVSALDAPPGPGASPRSAPDIADAAVAEVERRVGAYVWGRGDDTWPAALSRLLGRRGWRLAVVEIDTRGAIASLLGPMPQLGRVLALAADDPDARPVGLPDDATGGLRPLAAATRESSRCDVALAVVATPAGPDTDVTVAVVGPDGLDRHERRRVLLAGDVARERIAVAAASILRDALLAAATTAG